MKNKNQKKFNELPTKISRKNFNKFIEPYLAKGKRGPKPKISLYKTFNYILYVLHTGIQWENLPIRERETSWQAVYHKHSCWSKNGTYENLLLHSVKELKRKDFFILLRVVEEVKTSFQRLNNYVYMPDLKQLMFNKNSFPPIKMRRYIHCQHP